MTVRAAALLLLGAILGFAIGRVTVPEERGRGGEKRAVIPPPAARAPSIEETVPTEATPAPPEVKAGATSADVVQPSGPSEEAERGTLLVDFAGVSGDRRLWVGSLHMDGGFVWDLGVEAEEGDVVTHVTWPGTYDVCWLDAEGRRLGTRARLEAGKVTRVVAADHRTGAPIPNGLGVLSFFVEAVEGGGLGTEVSIHDDRHALAAWTNALGHGSTVIRPGRYRVSVGKFWDHTTPREVVVEAGRITDCRISHVREGDLVLVADRPLGLSVHPVGGRPHSSEIFIYDNDSDWLPDASNTGTTLSIPYLSEGEYEILIPFSLGAPIARFAIHANRATRVRCETPKGGVRVQLTVPEGCPSGLELELRRAEPIAGRPAELMNAAAGSPVEIALLPGRYRVTARYPDAEEGEGTVPAGEASAEIEVQDRMVDVALELPRPR